MGKKQFTFTELGLNPVKQFMFAPEKGGRLLLEKNNYREQIIGILLAAEHCLNVGAVLQHKDGTWEVIVKIDISAKEWECMKDIVISQDIPVAILSDLKAKKGEEKKETLRRLLERLDYYVVMIEWKEGEWEISEVPPFTDYTISEEEEEFDYLGRTSLHTTSMPEFKPVRAEEWRQSFVYNGVEFVLIASRMPDKMTEFNLEIENYGIGKSYLFGVKIETEEETLANMQNLLYDLYRKNPRTSELGFAINDCLKQIALNGCDDDIICDFLCGGDCDNCEYCDEHDDEED